MHLKFTILTTVITMKKIKQSFVIIHIIPYTAIIFKALIFSYILSHLCLMPVYVEGQSMNPTVKDGTIGLSNIAFRHVFGLTRFDIVLIQRENGEVWVKRVIGLPNETLSIKDNVLYINQKPCPQRFLSNTVKTNDYDEIQIGADEVFVMGDNREHSYDSRNVGTIPLSDIISKDLYAVLP